ncbi:hypothetical protein MMC13_001963 [Lambiella insularis]|nr:hypothetical protein [Lambiella insularis]
MATAAVADAKNKDAKRKKLDESITEAADALKSVETDQKRRLQALQITAVESRTSEAKKKLHVFVPRVVMLGSSIVEHKSRAWTPFLHTVERAAELPRSTIRLDKERLPAIDESGGCEAMVEESSDTKIPQGPSPMASDLKGVPEDGSAFNPKADTDSTGQSKGRIRRRGLRVRLRIRKSSVQADPPVNRSLDERIQAQSPFAGAQDHTSVSRGKPVSETEKPHTFITRAKHVINKRHEQSTSFETLLSTSIPLEDRSLDLTKGRVSREVWNSPVDKLGKSTHRLAQRSTSTAKLIYRLLLICLDETTLGECTLLFGNGTSWRLTSHHRQELYVRLADMEERLSKLRSKETKVPHLTPLSFPNYCLDFDNELEEDSLHRALQNTLTQVDRLESLLPKICYNLLISRMPPTVHTYNMLIIRLCQLQYYEVASAVIDSMFECRVRPNEITAAAVLRFYSFTNDFDAFKGYIARMNAERGRGLMTAPLSTKITLENRNHFVIITPPKHREDASSPCSVRGHTKLTLYIEKAPRNLATYSALICGWLNFSNLQEALKQYAIMIRSGWPRNLEILTALLRYCALTRDWPIGLAIWNEVILDEGSVRATAYYWMLQLCSGLGKSEEFDRVMQHGASRNIFHAVLRMQDFRASAFELSRESRLEEMLAGHLRVPGIPGLKQRMLPSTDFSPDIETFLSRKIERWVEAERRDRAIKHLSRLESDGFKEPQKAVGELIPPIIKPYRYLGPTPKKFRRPLVAERTHIKARRKIQAYHPSKSLPASLAPTRKASRRVASHVKTPQAVAFRHVMQDSSLEVKASTTDVGSGENVQHFSRRNFVQAQFRKSMSDESRFSVIRKSIERGRVRRKSAHEALSREKRAMTGNKSIITEEPSSIISTSSRSLRPTMPSHISQPISRPAASSASRSSVSLSHLYSAGHTGVVSEV